MYSNVYIVTGIVVKHNSREERMAKCKMAREVSHEILMVTTDRELALETQENNPGSLVEVKSLKEKTFEIIDTHPDGCGTVLLGETKLSELQKCLVVGPTNERFIAYPMDKVEKLKVGETLGSRTDTHRALRRVS